MIFLKLTDLQKLTAVRFLAIAGFITVAIYAPKLWISTKDFPVVPIGEWVPLPSYPFDYFLAFIFFGLMLGYLFFPKRWLGLATVAMYVVLCFIDQNRLQPYFYQSILTLFFLSIYSKKATIKTILFSVTLIFFGTYFWSGAHKINEVFFFQWMHALQKHFSFIPEILLQTFTYLVPFIELLLGIFLFVNKTRKLSIILTIAMHSTIVIMLFYLGYGYNVVPWNIQNIFSVLILFWFFDSKIYIQNFFRNFNYKKGIVILFTVILPFSNLFGGWDHLLSFSFFTSKLNYYYIEINDKQLEAKLPDHVKKYYREHNGTKILYPNEWAGDVNKVLFYPERRMIVFLNNYLKSFAENPKKENLTTLVVYNQKTKKDEN